MSALHNLIYRITEELEQSNRELADMASMDALTGLSNRRQFDKVLTDEIHRINRSDELFSLILLDVDFFKFFNDTYGHVAGDDCLRQIGGVLNEAVKRNSDHAFRYGGEEFACILPFTDRKGAKVITEEIKGNIAKLAIPHEKSQVSKIVTISAGVLTIDIMSHIPPSGLTDICDSLLYHAKKSGRNQAVYGSLSKLLEEV